MERPTSTVVAFGPRALVGVGALRTNSARLTPPFFAALELQKKKIGTGPRQTFQKVTVYVPPKMLIVSTQAEGDFTPMDDAERGHQIAPQQEQIMPHRRGVPGLDSAAQSVVLISKAIVTKDENVSSVLEACDIIQVIEQILVVDIDVSDQISPCAADSYVSSRSDSVT